MKRIIGLGLLGAAVYIGWRFWPRAQAAPAPAAPVDTGKVIRAINEFWGPVPAPAPAPTPAPAPAPAPDQPYVGIPPNELGHAEDPFLLEPIAPAPRKTFGIAYPGGSVTFDESAGSGQLNQILF